MGGLINFKQCLGVILPLTVAILIPGMALPVEPPTERVRIAGAFYLGDAPTVVASERGLFAAHGIEAEVSHLASGKLSLAKLRAGEADFALTALTPVVLDRLADADPGGWDDPVILASLAHSGDLLQIITLDRLDIRSVADMRGKRVAIDRGTNAEFVWWLHEQYHGIERAVVELVDLSFPDIPAALVAGRIDAAVLWEPHVSILKDAQPGTRHFHLHNLYAGKWVLVTTRRTAQERRALCRQVLAAYGEAIAFMERRPDEALALFSQRMDVATGVLAAHWNALDYGLHLDWGLIAGLQEQLHWAQAVGYDNGSEPVRVLDLIDAGPLGDLGIGAVSIPAAVPPDRVP